VRRSALLLVPLLMTLFGSPAPAYAVQRVVFADKTFLDVEDAWRDDKYVHFVYQGRPITVLRSDVLRIEGSRPIMRPLAAPACPAPRPGDDDQAVRGYFRCLGVHWVRAPVLESSQWRWVYEGVIGNRLERYVVSEGRIIEAVPPAKP
jgi:hypothetical protein